MLPTGRRQVRLVAPQEAAALDARWRWLVGMGMATATYPANLRPASALVRLKADGSALVQAGSQDIGTGTYTVMTQIAADALGLPLEKVTFELGDTKLPETPGSGGSQTASSVGSAVKQACTAARALLFELAIADPASPLLGASVADLDIDGGVVRVKKSPEKNDSIAALVKRSGKDEIAAKVDAKPKEERKKFSCHSHGAQFAEVRVDESTGEIRVSRVTSAFAGRQDPEREDRAQPVPGRDRLGHQPRAARADAS